MRKVFVLSRPLMDDIERKHRIIDGKFMTVSSMVELLQKQGHIVDYIKRKSFTPSKMYKGIQVRSAHWGNIVWAKKLIDNCKLGEQLVKDGLVLNSCMLPVEKREDSKL